MTLALPLYRILTTLTLLSYIIYTIVYIIRGAGTLLYVGDHQNKCCGKSGGEGNNT